MEHFKHIKTFQSYSQFQGTFLYTTLDNTVHQRNVLYQKNWKSEDYILNKTWILDTLNLVQDTSLDLETAEEVLGTAESKSQAEKWQEVISSSQRIN